MNTPIDITGITLTTERLLLRPWRESDLADFHEYARVDGVGQMAGWAPHRDLEESRQILSRFIAGKRTFALEYQGKVIGSLGIEQYDERLYPEFDRLQVREIGYVLSKDYWGQGLMPEAVRAVISYLFNTVRLDRIIAGHFDWNFRSRRVIEKCGFRYCKTVPFHTNLGTTETALDYILYPPDSAPKHRGTQSLETSRLLLRRITAEDAQPMFDNWASDSGVTKFLSWPAHAGVEVTKAVIDSWLPCYKQADYYQWVIVLKENGTEPIGMISVVNLSDHIQKAEIGYCLGKQWWHKGIMSEALNAVIDFLFTQVGMNRIEAKHDPNNPHSGGVMQKCGMRYEGTTRASFRNNQGICDSAHYAILRSDWLQRE